MMAETKKQIVLGVDDDSRVREAIESLLDMAGYEALVFSSADELLRSRALATADCVITDVRMPGMDGIELQRRIKVDYPKLPVIFISAHFDDEIRRQALDGGAVDFMYKPFDGDALLRAIDRAVNNSSNDPV
jgi:FixJ family two-component response regulator